MTMSAGHLALNLAYLALILGSLDRDLVRLRLLLITASINFMAYAALAGVWSMVFWNLVIGSMHFRHLAARRWAARSGRATSNPADSPVGLEELGPPPLFSRGREMTLDGTRLIRSGDAHWALYLLLEGRIDMTAAGRFVGALGSGALIGDPLATGAWSAPVDLDAAGSARVWRWTPAELDDIGRRSPTALAALTEKRPFEIAAPSV